MRKSYFSSMAKNTAAKPKIKWLRYVLLGVIGLGIYHVLNGPSGGINLWKLKQANAKEVKSLDSLTARKHELEIEKTRLEKDSGYIEKVARKELGMSKPGEKVFRFAAPDSTKTEK